MAESKELKKIKKLYGEKFMHLCRQLFSTILDQEGLLTEILTSSISTNSRTLYEDIIENKLEEDFKNYIYNKIDVEKDKQEIIEIKTPYELLEKAGYDLYECNSEEEIQSFKKYYAPQEELCTFNGNRLDRCVVFWAVKKGAENIKREDFENPKREDEYGTSVMGIQFDKIGQCTVSIKNRYNHTVNNPDATYGNDLNRIIPGLTQSFAELLEKRGLQFKNTKIESLVIPGYTVAGDGKYYKYNYEINGKYYCPGNVIIDNGKIVQLEPEKQVLMDYSILDKESKILKSYDRTLNDSFIDGFEDIEKIEIKKNDEKEKGNRVITIKKANCENPITIEINKDNIIEGYKNENLEQVGNNFLYWNEKLNNLELPNLKKIKSRFLNANTELDKLDLPNLKQVTDDFLLKNKQLRQLKMTNLEKIGSYFLFSNKELSTLELPNLKQVDDYFLYYNIKLNKLQLPHLEKTGKYFLEKNKELTQLELPNLKQVEDSFLSKNKKLTNLELPNLEQVGRYFVYRNEELNKLDLPNLKQVGDYFLENNQELTQLQLPSLEQAESKFLYWNKKISKIELPNLKQVGNHFLSSNENIKKLKLPKLKKIEDDFLSTNKKISQLELPSLEHVGDNFLHTNKELSQLELPSLEHVGDRFIPINENIKKVELPNLKEAGRWFLYAANRSNQIELPDLDGTRDDFIHNDKKINIKTIAELDKSNNLTTMDINLARRIIGEILDKSNDKNNDHR